MDDLRMCVIVICILAGFLVIPLTAASFAYDVGRTRRSAELGAYYGFIAYFLFGILLGL